jgi:GNAT superfamily N-acetyltransferase
MALQMQVPRALDYFEEVDSITGVSLQSPSGVVVTVFGLLQDEAKAHGDGFHCNLHWLLHAYATGHFYMMDNAGPLPDDMRVDACLPSDRIPAFLALDFEDPKKSILWVHEKFRRHGCGRHLVEWMLGALPETAHMSMWAIRESVPFWTKMGYRRTGTAHGPDSIEMTPSRKRPADDLSDEDTPVAKRHRDGDPPRKWYLSIDIEGRGSSLSNPITAIGVFFAPADEPGVGEKKRWALQPLPGQVDEERCIREFWARYPLVDAWIRAGARPAAEVMAEFQDWCRAAVAKAGGPGYIVLVSHCPDYDIGRLDHLGHVTGTWDNTLRYLGVGVRHWMVDPSERFEQLVPGAARHYQRWAFAEGGGTNRLLTATHFPDDDAEQAYYLQRFCDKHLRK